MAEYRDNNGFTWPVYFDVKTLRAIRNKVKMKDGRPFDPLDITDTATIQSLASDPVLVVDVLWVLEESAARAAGKSWDDFQTAHRGEVLQNAVTAIAEGLADFFPALEGLAVKESLRTIRIQREQGMAQIQRELKLKETQNGVTPTESGGSSTNTPESVE